MNKPPVSQPGDLFILDEHRLICGDAPEAGTLARPMSGERAAMGLHDASYDVPISGHVAKPGRHREFIMGAGELGENFTPFLTAFLVASTARRATSSNANGCAFTPSSPGSIWWSPAGTRP